MDMVSSFFCKCQTRAGVSADINKSFECVIIADSKSRACVSADINKSFECVTIADSKFSSRVVV